VIKKMLDFIVFIAIIFAIGMFIVGLNKQNDKAYFVSAAIFVVLGIALFTSGWQTYDVPNYTITDVNADIVTITATPFQITANIAGSGEEQIIFALASFFVLIGLVSMVVGYGERRKNKFVE